MISIDNGNTMVLIDDLADSEIEEYWERFKVLMDADVCESISDDLDTADEHETDKRHFLEEYLRRVAVDLVVG